MNKKALWILIIPATALMVMTLEFQFGCSSEPAPRTRIVTVQAQIDQAQQAAKDAQAAADVAVQTEKNIQAAISKMNGRTSDGSWKIGQPQVSSIGMVTAVGESKSHDGTTDTFTFWFTFAERGGFVKQFVPVCPNQAVPVNSAVILNFHWKEYENSIPGCYLIDGYTAVK